MKNKLTYISLFSSGGVGCFGFKKEGFECISTVEIIEKRLNIQKINNKCKYESGYICDDITLNSTKHKIFKNIDFWKKNENIDYVDVIIATPPCQGMSTANSKKKPSDIIRNSLIVESIDLITIIKPRFFIFENVPSFLKTECIAGDKKYIIKEYLYSKLSNDYNIYDDVINFKNYNVPSSRTRCLVLGVLKTENISPSQIFPKQQNNLISLKESIYHLPRLSKMGEIDNNDIFHFFRSYREDMRKWIELVPEGKSAYDNIDLSRVPHTIKNGKIIYNKNKMGGKYTRQSWNKVGPCIHTRNDTLASQNTIHPEDDRVFSIRELMILMSIPNDFLWSNQDLSNMELEQKRNFLKKNEINIRQIIGEAVPTEIFWQIAKNIKYIKK